MDRKAKCSAALQQLAVVRDTARGWFSELPRDGGGDDVAIICQDCDEAVKTPEYGTKDKDTKQCPAGSHADEDSDSGWNPWDEDNCVANYTVKITQIKQQECTINANDIAADFSSGPVELTYSVIEASSFAVTEGTTVTKTVGGKLSAGGTIKVVDVAGEINGSISEAVKNEVSTQVSTQISKTRKLNVPVGKSYGVFPIKCKYVITMEFTPNDGYQGPAFTAESVVSGRPGTLKPGIANSSGGYAGPIT